ncbi:MAG: hypothetical protein CMP54_01885 [Flavobacteriales bacterium]|nr:hypothetical protein [Flavobacteriales bacterium]
MKKSILILGTLLIALSTSAFAQKHKPHHYNNNHHVSNHHGFFGGILTGILFSELLKSNTYSYREMYFEYKAYKNTWKLKKDFAKNGLMLYGYDKVTAKFENPSGGRDFVVHVNSRGEWELNCPRKLAKVFKNKVRRNL